MGFYHQEKRRPVRFSKPSRAIQSAKESCDINFIVRQYRRTGNVAHLSRSVPKFMDVSEVGDFRSMLDQVHAVREYFQDLPSKVRAHFDNDPVKFMDAVSDPTRVGELAALRIKPVEKPAEVAPEAPGTVST